MEKELQDEAAKKNAAIKVIWVVKFSRKGTKLDRVQNQVDPILSPKENYFVLSIGIVSNFKKTAKI